MSLAIFRISPLPQSPALAHTNNLAQMSVNLDDDDPVPHTQLSRSHSMLQAVVLLEDALAQRKPEHLMDPASIRFYRWCGECFRLGTRF